MSANTLRAIDWTSDSYTISGDMSVELSPHTGISREDIIQDVVRGFDLAESGDYYVYTLEIDKDGETSWYVGQTSNLFERVSTHLREKTVRNIERVETANSRAEALEREREMSYEVAIDKQSTNIFGGR